MKSGSKKILFMIGVYVTITVVMFLIFGPLRSSGSNSQISAVSASVSEERIIGDAYISSVSVSVSEKVEEPEPVDEPEPVKPEEPVIHYYHVKVQNAYPHLFIREGASKSYKVLGRLKNGREGYVLEKGDEWSKIFTADEKLTGYCFNEYLEFTEISREEFPQKYVDQAK